MQITKIRIIGSSLGVSIPAEYSNYFNMEKGDYILWYLDENQELQIKYMKDDIKYFIKK